MALRRYNDGSSSPVQIHLQIWDDELVLDELPDDPSHLVPLHLHHRTCVDLLRHGKACLADTCTCNKHDCLRKRISLEGDDKRMHWYGPTAP